MWLSVSEFGTESVCRCHSELAVLKKHEHEVTQLRNGRIFEYTVYLSALRRTSSQVVAPRHVEEVTKALFHTILLHRTTGKVYYGELYRLCVQLVSHCVFTHTHTHTQYSYSGQHSGTFSVGVVGMEDVDLSSLDFTYVSYNLYQP